MFEYDQNVMNAADELDKHDLTTMLTLCWKMGAKDPWSIRSTIQSECIPSRMDIWNALEELSDDELMMYLGAKYNIRFEEIISYQMLRPSFIDQ